ncbi:hypothetical protein PAMP_017229 [Pampus punctatissimus]
MRTLTLLLLVVLAFTSTTAKKPRSQFTRYRSWNSQMYPVWKDGDARFRNCWSGGEVTFDLKNDAPTLTGARVNFNINLIFPPNQTVLSDGQVVWARNCTINGQQYQEGQAVYPNQDTQSTGVFPDGTPFTRSQGRKPQYVFVWKTWGRYWQVADGPSSSLTIGTDNIPLGSYNMEVVIYHCRGQDKFIPLGYASTVFSITDQVPFTISLAQVNDINQDDTNFIQNRAIAFNVNLHDPSQYLSTADISFSWDFGDNTGTLISRERTVTHTYLEVGTFKPQVVLMASIPNDCGNPTAAVPVDASAAPVVVVMASTPAAVPAAPAEGGDTIALDVPASDATPLAASVQPAEAATNTDDGEAVVDTDTEEVEVASVAPAGVDAAVVPAEQDLANTVAPAADVTDAAAEETDAAAEETDAAAGDVATAAPIAPAAEEPADADTAAADETAVQPATDETVPAEGEVQAEVETDAAQVALVLAKRQAPELTADCMVYRYGSLATSVDVVQGIESVEIVQMSNVVSMATALDQNAVDVTITCQGSLPSEVCTVISDADCITPVETVCNAASPSPDCQIILPSGGSPAGTAATVLGVMVLACIVCCIGLMYRRFKQYQPLSDDHADSNGSSSGVTSVPLLLWNLLSRQSPGESRPLLQGRIV